jgi:uncharacterized protein YukE
MTFRVEPQALRRAAAEIGDTARVAAAAGRYTNEWGDFSLHDSGLIGKAAPGHRRLMADLTQMLAHLGELGHESARALAQTADHYEHTDQAAEARVDASYPVVAPPNLHTN